MGKFLLITAALAMAAASVADARRPVAAGTPANMQRLLACRSIQDSAQRLACFDRETANIDQAMARKDLVVIDRERATAAKRSLFGFSVPSFGGLFGGDENEVKEIQSTITAVATNADGGWTLRLADGSTWTQTDDAPLGIRPARGQKVVVRRALLGAFRVSISGQPGFKAKRIG